MVSVDNDPLEPEPPVGPLLPPFQMSRSVWRATLTSAAFTIGLTLAYCLLPLDGHLRGNGFILLVVSLVVIAVFSVIQLRAILQSKSPGVRGVQALLTLLALLLLSFASIYVITSHTTPGSFTEPLNRVDGVYFAVTVFATVGFGDIAPVTSAARIMVTAQMLFDLAVLGIGVRVILGAVRIGRQRRSS